MSELNLIEFYKSYTQIFEQIDTVTNKYNLIISNFPKSLNLDKINQKISQLITLDKDLFEAVRIFIQEEKYIEQKERDDIHSKLKTMVNQLALIQLHVIYDNTNSILTLLEELKKEDTKNQKTIQNLTKRIDELKNELQTLKSQTNNLNLKVKTEEREVKEEKKEDVKDVNNLVSKYKNLVYQTSINLKSMDSKRKQTLIHWIDILLKDPNYLSAYNTLDKISDNKFDTIYNSVNEMSNSNNDVFKQKYLDKFYINGKETKLRELLVATMGVVTVFIKLKVDDNENNLITIDNTNINLKISEEETIKYPKSYFNGVVPNNTIENQSNILKNKLLYQSLNNINDHPILLNKFTKKILPSNNLILMSNTIQSSATQGNVISKKELDNLVLYNKIENILNLIENGLTVFLFCSGYSGSGKTHTLLKDEYSILKKFLTSNLKTVFNKYEIYALEQYGKLSFDNKKKPSDIFKKLSFDEYLIRYSKGTNNNIIVTEEKIENAKISKLEYEKMINLLDNDKQDNISNLSIEIDNLFNKIEQYRKQSKKIKATINNLNSSRSHMYYIIRCYDKNNQPKGQLILVDNGGQENSREILLDYVTPTKEMVIAENTKDIELQKKFNDKTKLNANLYEIDPKDIDSKFLNDTRDKYFSTYFTYLYSNKEKLIGSQYNSLTVNDIFKKYTNIMDNQGKNKTISESYKKFFSNEFQCIMNSKIISDNDKWFRASFICPIDLFVLIKFATETEYKYSSNDLIDYFNSLGRGAVTAYHKLTILKETLENFRKSLQDKVNRNISHENKDSLIEITHSDLIDAFLEGFYINETLNTKLNYLLNKQNKTYQKANKYISIFDSKFDPFNSYNLETNMTENLYNSLIELNPLNQNAMFIEIGTIRGEQILIENKIDYKYAKASLITLKHCAMISYSQDLDNGQKGGHYYKKYKFYKNLYLKIK